jgi:hypothetical protein
MTPKGTQQPGGKRKGKDKKGGGNNNKNVNKPKSSSGGGGGGEKRKVKFPCNICKEYHLTHEFPKMEESQRLLAQQQPFVLTNPFPTRTKHGFNI